MRYLAFFVCGVSASFFSRCPPLASTQLWTRFGKAATHLRFLLSGKAARWRRMEVRSPNALAELVRPDRLPRLRPEAAIRRIEAPTFAWPTFQPPLHMAIQPFLGRGFNVRLCLVLRPSKWSAGRSNADLGEKAQRRHAADKVRRAHVRSPRGKVRGRPSSQTDCPAKP